MNRVWLIAVLMLLLRGPASGQDEVPDQVPPSPTTQLFQKYGDYPVSHYTGIPDIKVPIYTIQEGDITVPIYLSFHASGLNIDEQVGVVAKGWTLHTGGMISRTINGLPDEYTGMLIPDFGSDYTYSYGEMEDTYMNRLYDHELDVYSYNFLGRSGKYLPSAQGLLDEPQTGDIDPFMLKQDNLKFSTLNPVLLTDENGVYYWFGGTDREEYQDFESRIGAMGAISTWHLASINSARYPGMGVGYQYQRGPDYLTSKSWQAKLDDYFSSTGDPTPYYPYSLASGNNAIELSNAWGYYTKVPQKINFSSGYLLFLLNSARQLEKIEIYNKHNQLLRIAELVTDHFPNNDRRLKAVVFKDASNVEQERYSFTYYNENGTASKGKDHWGFYNGTTFTGDYLIGFQNYNSQVVVNGYFQGGPIYFGGSAYREPSASAAQTYMLEKVTYPTGGHTIFQYEGNRDQGSNLIGGLRIKTISSYTATGQMASQKSYTYQPGWPELSVNTDLYLEHDATIFGINYDEGRRVTIRELPAVSLFPKGAPMGYQQVAETEGDMVTTYKFDDWPAYIYERMDNPGYSVVGESSPLYRLMANHYKPWNFGDLQQKIVVSPGYRRTESYSYEDFIRKTVHDLVIYQHVFPIANASPTSFHNYTSSSIYNFSNRYHYSAVKRLVNRLVSEEWADNREISSTEEYEYSNPAYPMQRTAVKITTSEGENVRTEYKYAYDYPLDPVYQQLTLQHRISTPIEETQANLTQSSELKKIRRDHAFYNPFSPNPGTPQLSAVKTSVGGAALDTEVNVDRYDSRGHILQQTGKGGLVTSFIFGYGQLYPVARIVGADYNTAIALVSQAFLDNSSNTEADIRNHLSALRTSLPSAQITTYTYKLGIGMSSETDARGQTVYYEYDLYQRLKETKDADGNILKSYDYHLKP